MPRTELIAWMRWVHSTSVPLVRMTPSTDDVIGIASSWLLDVNDKRILIAARHSLAKDGEWAVDIGPDAQGINQVSYPSKFCGIGSSSLDLCAARVPQDLLPIFQQRGPMGMFGEPVPYHVFRELELAEPDAGEVFAFAGKIGPEFLPDDNSFFRQPVVYGGLRLQSKSGDALIFILPDGHPGHDAFHGCSGAPIVDQQRRCIGIVTGGDASNHTIFGSAIAASAQMIGAL